MIVTAISWKISLWKLKILNDIMDQRISDMRLHNASNANDHATLRRKRASTTMTPREHSEEEMKILI